MSEQSDEPEIVRHDPWLAPYADRIRARRARFDERLREIDGHGGLIGPISEGHRYFGFTSGMRDGVAGIWYREWAPAAHELSLVGDFNGWRRGATALERGDDGVWSVFVPDRAGLRHSSRVKTHVVSAAGRLDRIPAYARRVVQDPATLDFTAEVWLEPRPVPAHSAPSLERQGLRIYEAHAGMAQEEARIATFAEFAERVLPRIARLGYDALQLMAVQEHPYYGSFGYHVSSFYAVSSRFGTPDDFARLVDAAHGLGLLVIMDLVHSHAATNINEGLNAFDGTPYQYFHDLPRGRHPAWDSLIFDYGKPQVQQFLLSNVRYWLEEYGVDGFRFDGVTSMLYYDHGLGKNSFTYDDHFGPGVDGDAVVYLQLANTLTHMVRPDAVTIAEDVSGMPGVARPVGSGGIGFDYRLAMGVPDFWVRLVKDASDEQWSPSGIFWAMVNRRRDEKHIAYVESHDQALVGDKTLAFRLMDAQMYWHMARTQRTAVVDRGIALLKIIRLITFFLGGEGYLNFMGNEFAHPEWVDFPREGNGWSYHYARRQWSLAANPDLLYGDVERFDAALMGLDKRFDILTDEDIELTANHDADQWMVCRRGPLVLAVNLSPHHSREGLWTPTPEHRTYEIVLNTDEPAFGGFGLSNGIDGRYPQDQGSTPDTPAVRIYLPPRTAQVLAPV